MPKISPVSILSEHDQVSALKLNSSRKRKAGSLRPYQRQLDLTQLIPLWPRQREDYSADGTLFIINMLRKALRSERNRGKSGHWTYSLFRHKALIDALAEEKKNLHKARMAERRKELHEKFCAKGIKQRLGHDMKACHLASHTKAP